MPARSPARRSATIMPARSARAPTPRSTSDTPFVERLVHFWANHFAVSADKLQVIGLPGTLEFEAIRPHVLGTLRRHAARGRAASGDAALSRPGGSRSAPTVRVGARVAARGQRKVGLNENLAREIMELHTLGVRTGYTPGRRHRIRARDDRLDGRRDRRAARRARSRAPTGRRATSSSRRASTSPATRTIMGKTLSGRRRGAGAGRARRSRRPPRDRDATSRPSSPGISPATRRRRRWSRGWQTAFLKIGRRPADRLPRADRLARGVGRRRRSSSRRRGNGRSRRCARSASTTVEPQAVPGLLNQLGQPVWKPGSARRL